jgi:endo-1,4-beta-xylanase
MRRGAVFVTIVLATSGSLASVAGATGGCEPLQPETCSIGELAANLGIRFGTTLEDFEIADSGYVSTLLEDFTSITPENALKLYATQSSRGTWNFAAADAVVAFAESEGLAIRGHTLVWAQDNYTPAWVRAISDPNELWTVTSTHITEVMTRYHGRITRWDVVNEPLATFGTGQSSSVMWNIGSDWIKRAFDLAHSLDPQAELWINEFGTDWVPGKHQAFLTLVENLLDAGAPIDGVGLQTHRLPGVAIDRRVFERQLRDFANLGVKVAITELDVPVSPTDPGVFDWQATEYAKVVAACAAVSNCTEITVWGLSDRDTWLDGLGTFAVPTRPLLFDNNLQAKPAHASVRDELARAIRARSLPATGEQTTTLVGLAFAMIASGVVLRPRRRMRSATRQ